MHEKLERAKTHLKENKKFYAGLGAGVIVGGLTGGVVMLRTPEVQAVQKIIGPAWKPTQTIIQFVERSTPSKPVHLVGTDLYFDSINDAARKTGHSISAISQVVNGHREHAGGDIFEFLQKA